MQKENSTKIPLWFLPHLFGVDVAVAVYAWVVAYARLFDVIVVPSEPIFLLCIAAWILVSVHRFIGIVIHHEGVDSGWRESFFRTHLFLVLLILLCAFLAVFWLALFQVGIYFLKLLVLPACYWLFSIKSRKILGAVFQSLAFALGCSTPAWLYCLYGSPLDMAVFPPSLALTALMILFFFARKSIASSCSETSNTATEFLPFGLLALILYCAYMVCQCVPHERFFYYAIAVSVAFMQILIHLRVNLSKEVVVALEWPLLALSATVAYFLF